MNKRVYVLLIIIFIMTVGCESDNTSIKSVSNETITNSPPAREEELLNVNERFGQIFKKCKPSFKNMKTH